MPRAAKDPVTGLTHNQEKFCVLYVNGPEKVAGNGAECVRRSFKFKKAKKTTVQRRATELLNMATIQARIAVLRREVAEVAVIERAEVLRIAAAMARVKIADFYNQDGTLKLPHEWTEEMKIGAASLEVFEEFEGHGKDREFVGYIKKFRLWDKNAAVDRLFKHFGMFEKDNEQKTDPVRELLKAIDGRAKLTPPGAAAAKP